MSEITKEQRTQIALEEYRSETSFELISTVAAMKAAEILIDTNADELSMTHVGEVKGKRKTVRIIYKFDDHEDY